MLSKLLGIVLFSAVASLMLLHPTHAHVLITNNDDTICAVLHITPDDDPEAGKASQIFFDIQDTTLSDGAYKATLTVENTATNKRDGVDMKTDGSYVSGEYTFENQGVYRMTLEIKQGNRHERFVVAQRVSRGTPAQVESPTERHRWAEFLLVASSAAAVALTMLVATRARAILRRSQ